MIQGLKICLFLMLFQLSANSDKESFIIHRGCNILDFIFVDKKLKDKIDPSLSFKYDKYGFSKLESDIIDDFLKDKKDNKKFDIRKLSQSSNRVAFYDNRYKNDIFYNPKFLALNTEIDKKIFKFYLSHEYRHLTIDKKYPWIKDISFALRVVNSNIFAKCYLATIIANNIGKFIVANGSNNKLLIKNLGISLLKYTCIQMFFLVSQIMYNFYHEIDADINSTTDINILQAGVSDFMNDHIRFKKENQNASDWQLRWKHFLLDQKHPYYLDRAYFIQRKINQLQK